MFVATRLLFDSGFISVGLWTGAQSLFVCGMGAQSLFIFLEFWCFFVVARGKGALRFSPLFPQGAIVIHHLEVSCGLSLRHNLLHDMLHVTCDM